MPSNHLILCSPLLLLPSIFPSIRVFSNESVLRIRRPKYWSFSLSISSSNEYSGLEKRMAKQKKANILILKEPHEQYEKLPGRQYTCKTNWFIEEILLLSFEEVEVKSCWLCHSDTKLPRPRLRDGNMRSEHVATTDRTGRITNEYALKGPETEECISKTPWNTLYVYLWLRNKVEDYAKSGLPGMWEGWKAFGQHNLAVHVHFTCLKAFHVR